MRKLANVTDSWGIAVKFTYKKVIQDNAALFNIVTGDFGTGEKITYPGVQSFPPYHRQGSLAGYPMQLLGVIDQAMVFGLREEIKLLVAAATPLIPHFDSIWSNWVQIISYIEKLATILGRHRRDDANAQTQPFFKLALHNVTSTLFSQRPIEPNDWKRSSDKVCSCKCSPCQWLQKFLDHPTQHTGKFAYAKHIRDHLQYQLDDQDFQFHTEKFRSPHTLVITKTKNEYARLAKEWHSDVEALRVRLQELRSDFLQSLLGHEYEPLLSLHQAPSTVGEHGYQALQAVSASVWNSRDSIQITGVKRKAIDVVDLTEDASEQY
jgi:hypothetical protein